MTDTDTGYHELAERLRALEDRLAITQLIASYGPAVDSGNASATAGLWTEDGAYDTYPIALRGKTELAEMVAGEPHQSLINGGCAHLLGPPHISIDADTATATGYSVLFLPDQDADGFRVWRVSANHWRLIRTTDGWRITNRINRVLDGSAEARALLGHAART